MKNNLIKLNTTKLWREVAIGEIAEPITLINVDNETYEVLSCTKHDGLVPSLKYFGRKVYGNDLSKYKIVPQGCFAYATNHIEEGSIGFQNILDKGLVSPMYTVFKVKDNEISSINPVFLYHLLKSPLMIGKYKSIISASVARRGGLRWKSFSKLRIVLPSIEEQRQIVDINNVWTSSIGVLQRKIENKACLKNILIRDVLTGKVRLNGYSQPWGIMTLKDILFEHKETSTGKEEVHSVSVSKGVVNQVEHLGRSFAAKETLHYKLVKPGDIIYTKSPTGDFPYGIIKQSRITYSAIVSPLYGVFTPKRFSIGSLLDYYFESPFNTLKYLKPIIHKGAKNTINITNKTFLSGKMYLPIDSKEQDAISQRFFTLTTEIRLLCKKLELLKDQKRYLLNSLIRGSLQLPAQKQKSISTQGLITS